MSRFINRLSLALLALVLAVASPTRSDAQGYYNDNSGYQQFYDELSPYGQWLNDPQYGYVWVPDAGSDFRPYYSNGYWAMTDYGNTWVSSYAWGWAPFHYGRWTYNRFYGWVWIPGNVWGPAWVSWRSGGGCYGWAPMGPGVSVSFSFGSSYYVPDAWWVFTPQRYLMNRAFQQYSYGPRYNNTYVHQTTIINNTYVTNNNTYISGPSRRDLQRATGQTIRPVAINTTNRPERASISNNRLNIYRPQIAEASPRSTERPRTFRNTDQAIVHPNSNTQQLDAGRSRFPSSSQQLEQQRNNQQMEQSRNQQIQQQRAQQLEQQRNNQQMEQSRNQQIQQQRAQQLEQQRNNQQMEQSRNQQMQQQRAQQLEQQRAQQMQQQRAAQEQQRAQQMQQQRAAQEQQRAQQMQQQRAAQEQQRAQQMQQQRAAQEQQRAQQMQQSRMERTMPTRESAPERAPEGRRR